MTVEAVLDAAIKLLKRKSASSMTTNAIAEVAGVSIGSVYQYFANKQAIFIALHERHIRQVDEVVERCLTEGAEAPLEEVIAWLLVSIIQFHAKDRELSELLQTEVPHSAQGTPGLSIRLYKPLRRLLSMRSGELRRPNNLDMQTFVLSNMLEAFGHAIVVRRPPGLSLVRAQTETVQAIVAYICRS